jgi:hypothetical protein
MEFSSTDRFFCANLECAKFIPCRNEPQIVLPVRPAVLELVCTAKHWHMMGGCPADEARQRIINFADEEGWKICFGCGEMVLRYEGYDHMT